MPFSHLLLVLLVVVVWGLNFIFVKWGLDECSPLLLCALRFFLASLPALFFVKPPPQFKLVALYGLIMFALQFALLFTGMYVGMTAGMASILMQTQVFFSIFFAALLLGEKIALPQMIGALVAFAGIGLVALHFDANISLAGFLLLLAAASTWGIANLITKKLGSINMMALVVWGSFVAAFPMLIFSFILEGPDRIFSIYHHVSFVGIASLFYITFVSTWIGYGVWNWLLSHHPVSTIAPFSLLIPIVGVLSSVLFLGEALEIWKVMAGLLVMMGLGIHLISTRKPSLRRSMRKDLHRNILNTLE